jgi:ABC-2 type transport system ATP-binding protein
MTDRILERPAGGEPASAAAPRRPIIEVRGLRKEYADTVAVDDLSFEVGEGEIFGFIGPNGAGKTTTLRIMATLLDASAGEVLVGGLSVESDAEEVRRLIGYLPDDFGVYEGITVAEYLDFFAAAFRVPRGRRTAVVRDVMELTDLGGLSGRMVANLSRGMRQRLCLAKTLVHDPRVLILDEPASALDPRARIELRELLKELRGMGKTIIISSHILTELSDLCTSVGIIEKGKLQFTGGIDAVLRRPSAVLPVTIRLQREEPRAAEVLKGHPWVAGVTLKGLELSFDYQGDPALFHELVKLLVDKRVPLLTISHATRNLERLFLEVTEGHVQ